MTKAEDIAKRYLNGEPVDLVDMIPELLDMIWILSSKSTTMKAYINNIKKAIDHHKMVESRR